MTEEGRSENPLFQVRCWGVRGTMPICGDAFRRFGGNTICIEVRCGDHVLLFDAGSGLPNAARELAAEGVTDFNLFFSHCHYDHISGLPFFKPMYLPGYSVSFWSGHLAGKMTTREMICAFIQPPWFPVGPDICAAKMGMNDFRAGDVLEPHPGIRIKTGGLAHPGGSIGYRIEWEGRSVAIITDTEHIPEELDPTVLDLIRDVDLFFYDTTYLEDEMDTYRGYGHSTWEQAIKLAKAANAGRVGFIHHAPTRTDDELSAIDTLAAKRFKGAFCAFDGQVIDV